MQMFSSFECSCPPDNGGVPRGIADYVIENEGNICAQEVSKNEDYHPILLYGSSHYSMPSSFKLGCS